MEDLKIRVNSEAESEEAQCLFFELGYRWLGCHGSSYFKINDNFKYITAYMRGMSLAQGHGLDAKKEITIPQLKDMVVLKRNDVGGELKYDPEDIKIAKGYDLDELAKEYKLRDRCEGETDEEYRYMLEHCISKETLNDKVASAEVARQEFIGVPFSDLPEFNFEAVDDFVESNVEQTLSDRESTYGSFRDVAELTSSLMNDLLRLDMSFVQREALHMICSKLARIANGDPNHIDSWHDIAGYATLVVKDINENSSED